MWGQEEDAHVEWGRDDRDDHDNGGVEPPGREARQGRGESTTNDNPGASNRRATMSRNRQLATTTAFISLRSTKEHIIDLMREQVDRATAEGTVANEAVSGDSHVHVMLVTLLPVNLQRAVFMAVVSRDDAYPRVRTLFGAPPYAFLRPEDAGMLRAEGFAVGRRNVTYDGFHVVNYSQFGAPHLLDGYDRQYRVSQEKDDEGAPVAFMALRIGGDPRTTFIVRLKKRPRAVRSAMLRDSKGRAALSFPQVGEVIRMRPTPTIMRMISANASEAAAVDVRVVGVRLSDHKASTAVIVGLVQ